MKNKIALLFIIFGWDLQANDFVFNYDYDIIVNPKQLGEFVSIDVIGEPGKMLLLIAYYDGNPIVTGSGFTDVGKVMF